MKYLILIVLVTLIGCTPKITPTECINLCKNTGCVSSYKDGKCSCNSFCKGN